MGGHRVIVMGVHWGDGDGDECAQSDGYKCAQGDVDGCVHIKGDGCAQGWMFI